MSGPVLLRASMSVAVVHLLQAVFSAVAAPATLYLVATILGQPMTPALGICAAIASALALVMFQPRLSAVPEVQFDAGTLAMGVLLRWVLLLVLLYTIQRVTALDESFSGRLAVWWTLVGGVVILIGQFAVAMAMRQIVVARQNLRHAVIVGVNPSSVLLSQQLRKRPEYCTRPLGFFDDRSPDRLESTDGLPLLGQLSQLTDYIRRENIDVVFVALPLRHIRRVMQLLDELRDSTVSIYYIPDVLAFDLIQSRGGDIGGVHFIAMYETPFYGYRGVLKRLSDIVFTLGILVIAAPVMLVVALLVKLTSRGPVIFKQRRYGLDGQEITVYKFRSMHVEEDGNNVRQATQDDTRITAIGRYLRRYSLDELPQLINVLQGRMSLVGPRPHAVSHNETYRQLINGYMMRHKVLPGITGLAQVSGCRGETAQIEQMQARVNYDLDYLRQWTPALDLQIIFKTLLQMIRGDKKAY